ncbi:uncharacterized iron-regulated membrane protein [Jatrophihabitans sp. GAS493]|uniref:PepSY-associated TM helix domain-containing protein n=1 Tax=Jatrophihabitans sp. GAS493 TaxID=1907575 RepID=UPI000BB78A30|nr:PepSY-associated TM helix domain-containing protein [Jatrophihabitans sp. GAS493]SOD70905.1 uncharacterized iron-regulated membrane protein [Jatrophihabitans sp. GAS493]
MTLNQETTQTPVVVEPTAAGAAKRPARRRTPLRKRKPVKKTITFLHRWTSLVLGLLLLTITTSGAAVVYTPEWLKLTNAEVFQVTRSDHPISIPQAIDIVDTAHPEFAAAGANVYSGLYEITSADDDAHPGFWGVDPGSGRITGYTNPNSGFMAFMNQIHECFFTCDDYPGYVPFLEKPAPTLGMHWMKDVTWAGFILGATGIFLLFLALSGVWLWWPGLKKWTHGFRVRWKKGRYARDYDLHQVIGMAAVPFLLIWGLTGAGFEFHWVSTAWYATTGGQQPPDYESFTSNEVKDPKTPDIGMAAAITSARTLAGDAKLVYASSPAADDPTATYNFYFAKGFDQYQHGAYPGEYGVDVDRHDASRVHADDLGHAATLSNQLYDNWGAPMFHYGQSVNGWWRIPWFLFGLTPILLAVTGVSTWLAKRGVKKRRLQARKARESALTQSAGEPTPLDEQHSLADAGRPAGD